MLFDKPLGEEVVKKAFIDSSNRCVVVTASLNETPFNLKIWVYQPAKVSVVGIKLVCILNSTFKPPVLSNESLATSTVSSSSTWCDWMAIVVNRISIHATTQFGRTTCHTIQFRQYVWYW